jgi:O-antigen/teichoic acid export membrane protein
VPESLFNAAAINLPLVMIASIAGAREAGFMLLAQRVTSIPIGLLGTNISRVYLVEGAERHRKGELGHFTRKLMRHLLLLGTGPFLALAILAPVVFPLVFGTEWHRAGVMVRWTVPYMLLQFVASPVSTIMTVTHKQHISFFLQLFGFTLIVAAIGLASWVAPKFSFEFFSVAAAVYYAVYVAVVLRHASATAGALGFGR